MEYSRSVRQVFTCLALALSLGLCALAGQLCEADAAMSPTDVPTDVQLRGYLSEYGWEVSGPPAVEEVTLPEAFGPAYDSYLDCQHACGFALEELAGETVTRYTYPITNYPTGEVGVYADLLVFQGQIVGGDVRCAGLAGFMEPLAQ